MTGDVHSPYQSLEMIKDIKAGLTETIPEPERQKDIVQAMDQIEKTILKDNRRLLKPLKQADKRIATGEINREILEPIYKQLTKDHIQSIRKNTQALLEIKTKVSREEWERAFQQVFQ